MDRVLVVDDNSLLRQLIVEYLTTFTDFSIVGEAGNGLEAVRLADKCRPDLVLMDLMMPLTTSLNPLTFSCWCKQPGACFPPRTPVC